VKTVDGESVSYIRIVAKRWWLIFLLLVATSAAILVNSMTAAPVYRAFVKLQVIAAEPQEVSLFAEARPVGSREEIVAVQTQFDAALRSAYVAWQTINDLNLGISAAELLGGLGVVADGEFLNVTFVADDPLLVEAIATTHVENGFGYYAEIRAKPSTVALQFIQEQLTAEEKALATAQSALVAFQLEEGLNSLPREVSAIQDQLRELRLQRDRLIVSRENAQAISDEYQRQAAETGSTEAAVTFLRQAADQDAVVAGIWAQEEEYDELISRQDGRMSELLALTTEFDGLLRAVGRVQSNYNFLTEKESEARLKVSQATNVSFIQIIEPARTPDRPAPSSTPKLLATGVVVSLLAGVILAFILEFLSSLRTSPDEARA
jgi:uncharacterized protein involved in exopolysaccharide biosynthesis